MPEAHCARIDTELKRDVAARSVKSTGCPGFGAVNVTVTGPKVPAGNAGMLTFAFEAVITLKPVRPLPESAGSTVTDPAPAVIDVKAPEEPGKFSVTERVGVQPPFGVGVGVGVMTGVGVGAGPPPAHCARIRIAF